MLAKSEGRWKMASFQNTRVRPTPSMDGLLMRFAAAVLRFRLAVFRWRHPAALTPAR